MEKATVTRIYEYFDFDLAAVVWKELTDKYLSESDPRDVGIVRMTNLDKSRMFIGIVGSREDVAEVGKPRDGVLITDPDPEHVEALIARRRYLARTKGRRHVQSLGEGAQIGRDGRAWPIAH